MCGHAGRGVLNGDEVDVAPGHLSELPQRPEILGWRQPHHGQIYVGASAERPRASKRANEVDSLGAEYFDQALGASARLLARLCLG